MEDTLRERQRKKIITKEIVLILVLMEDTLRGVIDILQEDVVSS